MFININMSSQKTTSFSTPPDLNSNFWLWLLSQHPCSWLAWGNTVFADCQWKSHEKTVAQATYSWGHQDLEGLSHEWSDSPHSWLRPSRSKPQAPLRDHCGNKWPGPGYFSVFLSLVFQNGGHFVFWMYNVFILLIGNPIFMWMLIKSIYLSRCIMLLESIFYFSCRLTTPNTRPIDLHVIWPIHSGLPALFKWRNINKTIYHFNHQSVLFQSKQ